MSSRDIPIYEDLRRCRTLRIENLIPGRLQLSAINEAFDHLADGEAVRQVFVFDE